MEKTRFYVVCKKAYDANGKFIVDLYSTESGQVEPSIWATTGIPEENIYFTFVDKVKDIAQQEEILKWCASEDIRLGRQSDLLVKERATS